MVQTCVANRKISFIRLRSSYSVKKFSCGDKDLDDFILNRASLFDKYRLSVSYACTDAESGQLLAYCSLANDKVAVTDFKDKTEFNRFRKKQGFPNEKRLKSDPAIKLCRLGVDVVAKGNQIGSGMLDYIKSMFFFENKAGCRFLTVDAYLKAVPFYQKNGFRFMNSEDDDPHTRLMYFDLMDLEA